jgi:superfamily II DNA/RNA helicase
VIVPTRELCLQVHEDLKIGTALGITSISVYGGVGYDEQIAALTSGAHVVVGTPGRLIDHLNRGNLDLSNVTELVLDEADEMLDMGFLPDVERLVEACAGRGPAHDAVLGHDADGDRQARAPLHGPPDLHARRHEAHETAPNVTQHFLQVHRMDKPRVLARILQSPGRGGVYVFVRTKHMADRLVNELEELAVPAIAIHGDLRQQTRERNLDRFRSGKATVLVATEVAARGLDVMGVTHVVNYDCPDDEKMYLHRIGRTARAGEAGAAVTFAEFNEVDRLNVIRKAVGSDTPIEQVFSTSDRLTELFDLPEERPWDHLGAKAGGRDARRSGGDRAAGERSGRERRRPGAVRPWRHRRRPARDRLRPGRGGAEPQGHHRRASEESPRERRTRWRPRRHAHPAGAGGRRAVGRRSPACLADPGPDPDANHVRGHRPTTTGEADATADVGTAPARGSSGRDTTARDTTCGGGPGDGRPAA